MYGAAGLMFAGISAQSLSDARNPKRLGTGCFWALLAASFLLGSRLSDFGNGLIVLGLVALGGTGALGCGSAKTTTLEQRETSARKRGNRLFIPALIIPLVALGGTVLLPRITVHRAPVADPHQVTLISLALGMVLALAVGMLWLKPPASAPLQEARRLADTIGWAVILPQLLAALGAVFALSGVGAAVGRVATSGLPLGHRFAAVTAYCSGMALFTVVMGNAFAAFPVMTAAIGVPLIVHRFGGNPAIMGAIGMLSGFCGTLTSPMAANFNIVPAALLELPNRNAVIRVQIPTAIPLLACNIVLMYLLVFRH